MKRIVSYVKRYYRRALAATAALVAVLAALLSLVNESEVAPTVTEAGSPARLAAGATKGSDTGVQSAAADKATFPAPVDLFAVRTWEPPPPPPSPPPPPPPPQAPPLPFRYLGRIDEAGQKAFMLSYGEQLLSVTVGSSIDDKYRLEKFEGGQLIFLYRPLNTYQTLTVGTAL